jgi:hypothetical protein
MFSWKKDRCQYMVSHILTHSSYNWSSLTTELWDDSEHNWLKKLNEKLLWSQQSQMERCPKLSSQVLVLVSVRALARGYLQGPVPIMISHKRLVLVSGLTPIFLECKTYGIRNWNVNWTQKLAHDSRVIRKVRKTQH